MPEATHDALFARGEELYAAREKLGNSSIGFNLIADNLRVNAPQINRVLDSSAVVQSLTSILGEGYFSYGHSYLHKSGSHDQSFHKDAPLPWGTRGGIRSHRPYWVLAFYYPQKTTLDIGATQVIPGTQYWNVDRADTGNTAGEDRLDLRFDRDRVGFGTDLHSRDAMIEQQWHSLDPHTPPQFIEVEKGSVLLVHFDLFHRGTRNMLGASRYLYKFEFTRTMLPRENANGVTVLPKFEELTDMRRRPVVGSITNWLCGQQTAETEPMNCAGSDADLEADRIANAYWIGQHNDRSLVEDFRSGTERVQRASMYGMTQSPRLARISALAMLDSRNVDERAAAAFLAGEVLIDDKSVIEKLIAASCTDEKNDVRTNAITALGKIGSLRAANYPKDAVVPIVDALIDAIKYKLDVPSSRMLGTNNTRQLAWLALLRIVSSSLAEHDCVHQPHKFVEAAKVALDREVDRYARQTAREVLLRLADFGCDQATRLATATLRNEQWCVSPSQ